MLHALNEMKIGNVLGLLDVSFELNVLDWAMRKK